MPQLERIKNVTTCLEREGTDGETQANSRRLALHASRHTARLVPALLTKPRESPPLGDLTERPWSVICHPQRFGNPQSPSLVQAGHSLPRALFPEPSPRLPGFSPNLGGPFLTSQWTEPCAPAGSGQCRASCGVKGTRPGNSHGGRLRRRGPSQDQVLHGTRRSVTDPTPTDEDTGAPGRPCRAGSEASRPGAPPQMLPPFTGGQTHRAPRTRGERSPCWARLPWARAACFAPSALGLWRRGDGQHGRWGHVLEP